MDEVADGLFVGTVEDAGNTELLSECGIETIVSLLHREPDDGYPSSPKVVTVPMKDGPRNEQDRFEQAVSRVLSSLEKGETLLVHCSAGASRSPAVAATALALQEDVRLETAFEQVVNHRTAADPHEAVVQQAAHVYTHLRE